MSKNISSQGDNVARNKVKVKSWKPGKRMPIVIKKAAAIEGIGNAARELGVDRTHLWRVLTGQRDSKRLLFRWQEWKKQTCAVCGK